MAASAQCDGEAEKLNEEQREALRRFEQMRARLPALMPQQCQPPDAEPDFEVLLAKLPPAGLSRNG